MVEIKENFEEVGGVVRKVMPDFIGVFDKSGKSIGEFNVKAGKFDTSKLKRTGCNQGRAGTATG